MGEVKFTKISLFSDPLAAIENNVLKLLRPLDRELQSVIRDLGYKTFWVVNIEIGLEQAPFVFCF